MTRSIHCSFVFPSVSVCDICGFFILIINGFPPVSVCEIFGKDEEEGEKRASLRMKSLL